MVNGVKIVGLQKPSSWRQVTCVHDILGYYLYHHKRLQFLQQLRTNYLFQIYTHNGPNKRIFL